MNGGKKRERRARREKKAVERGASLAFDGERSEAV
jgi:hypothetical protein